MKNRLEALKGVVEELIELEVGIDEKNGTMSLYSEFKSPEDLATYQAHPAHQQAGALIKTLVAGRAVCDYEN
jgi:quinol monooxygenase YgiN